MADNRELISALLRNPFHAAVKDEVAANPYAVHPEAPNRVSGGEIRNLPPRPNDGLQAALAENLSPTMGAYGAGSLATQMAADAQQGNWSGLMDAAPLALGMVAGKGGRGKKAGFDLRTPTTDDVSRQFRTPHGSISWTVEPDHTVLLHNLGTNWLERGQGHGGRLLDQFLAEADRQGVGRIDLFPVPLDPSEGLGREALVKFYQSRGFAPIDEFPKGRMSRKPKDNE